MRGTEPIRLARRPTRPYATRRRGPSGDALRAGLFAIPFNQAFYLGFVSQPPHLAAVRFDPLQAKTTLAPTAPRRDEVSAGLLLGEAPVQNAGLEVGAHVRLLRRLDQNVALFLGIDGSRVGSDSGLSLVRFSVAPGLRLSARLLTEALSMNASAEVGYATYVRYGDGTFVDPTALFGRAALGPSYRLLPGLYGSVRFAAALHYLTIGGDNVLRLRPQALLSLRLDL